MKINYKIGLLIIIVVLIVGLAAYVFLLNNSMFTRTITSATQIASTTEGNTSIQTPESTSTLPTPIAPFQYPNYKTQFVLYRDSIKNPVTGDIVTFSSSQAESGTVTVYDVLLNGEKIGSIAGNEVNDPIFSPNDQFASFETWGNLGPGDREFYINLIDFKDSKVISVSSPKKFSGMEQSLEAKSDIIDSYVWDEASDALDVTDYVVQIENGKLYRVSPKQIWRYDLATQQYTLIQVLPE